MYTCVYKYRVMCAAYVYTTWLPRAIGSHVLQHRLCIQQVYTPLFMKAHEHPPTHGKLISKQTREMWYMITTHVHVHKGDKYSGPSNGVLGQG